MDPTPDPPPMPLGDDERIDVNDFPNLWYWAIQLGVSRKEVERAVEAVGSRVGDIRRFLGK